MKGSCNKVEIKLVIDMFYNNGFSECFKYELDSEEVINLINYYNETIKKNDFKTSGSNVILKEEKK